MQIKKTVAAALLAGSLGAGATAFGAGSAAADPHWWHPKPPPPPGHVGHIVGVPPGHIGQWIGVPPGHWDKPWKWLR
ncbi:hypothetical protein ACQI4F_23655 [Mycolicibacterium vaccae]|uniref:hypothetical protein n=1 Tax=Mycolicibacterium vaccae TaxID=1810 RepID=UPI003CFB48B5